MKTVFIRAIEASVDEKASLIRATVQGYGAARFDADIGSFGQVPRSPFAYWSSDAIRGCFTRHHRFESDGRIAKVGLQTSDDFRFLRLATEVPPTSRRARWFPFAKGGAFSPFYADLALLVGYSEADQVGLQAIGRYGRGADCYLRPGLTWPRRTNGLSFRVLSAGCIFADKGPAAFVEQNDPRTLLALCGLLNSGAFGALISVQLARTELAQSFEVGLIQQTPIPSLGLSEVTELTQRARQSWSLKRRLDTRTENSHAFLLPALLQMDGDTLIDRVRSWGRVTAAAQAEMDALAAEIDDYAYQFYGISAEDRQRIEQGFGAGGAVENNPDDTEGDETDDGPADIEAAPLVASLLSWALGVAFGRFDVRLATRDREAPPEPEPFDPLPVCSPGMLTGDHGLPVTAPPSGYPLTFPTDGILVDDPGHPRDVVRAVRAVFEAVFDDANARWHEASELLGTADLRIWFTRDFFESHIKRYSKSRRKAPIYWQLGTASGSYSVWIYIHRATGDTLFRVLNEFLGPKLDHEKAKFDALTQESGANPSAAQRREIEQQETFVGELQALKNEVVRVAPLWRPNLDDGVILNFAPLWRLVPQSRSWQSECKNAWEKLGSRDYDWAHIAMHLWPEHVVPKCQEDRSLAIAHGLERVFWYEDESGTWRKNRVDDATVRQLIAERTSTSVKAALNDLMAASTSQAGQGRKSKGRSTASRPTPLKPAPAVPGARASDAMLDESTLRAVKAAIAGVAEGAAKADILGATGLSDADWNAAIAILLDRGEVTRTGQKRGTRYHSGTPGVSA